MSTIKYDPNRQNYEPTGVIPHTTNALTSAFMPEPTFFTCKRPEPQRPKTWIVGGAEYGRCQACGDIVRLNKPFFGSLHFC